MKNSMACDTGKLGIIAISSLGIGLVANHLREKPLPFCYQSREERMAAAVTRLKAEPSQTEPSLMEKTKGSFASVSLDDFLERVKNKRGLVLDARAEKEYKRAHVPGALSLPENEFEKNYANLKSRLETDKGQPLVVYCSSRSCEASTVVSEALAHLGYTDVVIFHGGWQEWVKAGREGTDTNVPEDFSQETTS